MAEKSQAFMSRWSDADLRRSREESEAKARETIGRVLAGVYLIYFIPLILVLPLLRAAEVSSIWEIVL